MQYDHRLVGEAISARRRDLDLTQAEAAAAAGVSVSTWQTLENGTAERDPRQRTREGVAAALRWKPGALDAVSNRQTPAEAEQPDDEPTDVMASRVAAIEVDIALLKQLINRLLDEVSDLSDR